VIIALNERMKGFNRQHIPYRNSLMTTILRDSLGGNCKTLMIATINSEYDNLEETLSTLRFSQRVG
jgi:kinesin family protein 6/9